MAKYRNNCPNSHNFHYCCPMPGKEKMECDDDTDVVCIPPGVTFEAPEGCDEIQAALRSGRIIRVN